MVLVGTQAGLVAALNASSGRQLASVHMGSKVTGMQLLPSLALPAAAVLQPAAGQCRQHRLLLPDGQRRRQRPEQLAAVCLAPGVIVLLDMQPLHIGNGGNMVDGDGHITSGGGTNSIIDALQLPGDVFSVPAAAQGVAGSFAVGCRDDNLYLFHCSVDEPV